MTFNILSGQSYLSRTGPGYILHFAYTGRRFVLLHGYTKKAREAPRREIETAQRRMAEVMKEWP